ncbi:hypothetical protein G7054_g6584 [Neopestalotiopsis clavispora]|nr:hypothetical protein G7054_g6584 [Neopestalotiopsis clavispora]
MCTTDAPTLAVVLCPAGAVAGGGSSNSNGATRPDAEDAAAQYVPAELDDKNSSRNKGEETWLCAPLTLGLEPGFYELSLWQQMMHELHGRRKPVLILEVLHELSVFTIASR